MRATGPARARQYAAAGLLLALAMPAAAVESTTADYALSVAGLPIGTGALAIESSGKETAVTLKARIGGIIDLGGIDAKARVTPGSVTFVSSSGSGKDASEANVASTGGGANRQFTYTGKTSRGPGKLSMSVAGGNATAIALDIPEATIARRVPVAEEHKRGIIDPLMVLAQLAPAGGALTPAALCGKRHPVFTGQVRFDLDGSEAAPAPLPSGAPAGWSATRCKVAYTPISGHRIDKEVTGARARTATLVFVTAPDGKRSALWSLSVPSSFGTFAMTVRELR